MDRIPVTLIAGSMGSGKTSLLNQLVRQHPDSTPLVILNEFGRTPLEHPLVVALREGPGPAGACICCARSQDLSSTLKQAPWRFSRGGKRLFSHVVIETPGQADPAAIVQALHADGMLAERYVVAGILTLIDARHGLAWLQTCAQAAQQVRAADCIVVSGPGQVDAAARETLLHQLKELNASAPCVYAPDGMMAPAEMTRLAIFAPWGHAGSKHD